MKVTEKDVDYVAALANLELTEDERPRILHDLNCILDYVDRLNRLDTTGVPPMTQITKGVESQATEQDASAMREDELYGLRRSLPHDEALANAPQSDGSFFLVPKVIER